MSTTTCLQLSPHLPQNPIAAVTHPNPYPYYDDLVARRLYRDDALGLWVATSADAVTAVLSSERCRVRPIAEPVPAALIGTVAGDIFSQLVRMSDGPAHHIRKQMVSHTMKSFSPEAMTASFTYWAQHLVNTMELAQDLRGLNEFCFHLPIYVLGDLLGLRENQLESIALWMSDFVRCLSPISTPEQLRRGKVAAEALLDILRAQLNVPLSESSDLMLPTDSIGLLAQSYEATAGLIGNTLVMLARHTNFIKQVRTEPQVLRGFIQEVARCDPPVHNTRRFVAEDDVVAGQVMQAGDMILLVLAAANRDPAYITHPAHIDPLRSNPHSFTFGVSTHACPGEQLAVAMTQAAVMQLLKLDFAWDNLIKELTYRPSANMRIPLFLTGATQA